MACEFVRAALAEFDTCVETDEGSRVSTHCLYPSFEPVNVYVVGLGDGFRVHDGGGAWRSAWMHGRDERLIRKVLTRQANKFRVSLSPHNTIMVDAQSADWLVSAILSVANAAAAGAHHALERAVSANEQVLRERILEVLKATIGKSDIRTDFEIGGESGKIHHFDFAVQEPDSNMLLISAVAPHPISIYSKYVAFADTLKGGGLKRDRFAVHDRPLTQGDVSLLLQVSEIVPVRSLKSGIQRIWQHEIRQ